MKRCPTCGESKPRTEFHANRSQRDGLSTYCKACRKETRGPDTGAAKRWLRDNPERRMLYQARASAKKRGLLCTITAADIVIPTHCPVLGLQLQFARGSRNDDASPTLDRINNSLGYIPGNVAVISWRANRIKSDATPDELHRIVNYVTSRTRDVVLEDDRFGRITQRLLDIAEGRRDLSNWNDAMSELLRHVDSMVFPCSSTGTASTSSEERSRRTEEALRYTDRRASS